MTFNTNLAIYVTANNKDRGEERKFYPKINIKKTLLFAGFFIIRRIIDANRYFVLFKF